MARWQATLEIKEIWDSTLEGETSIKELATEVVRQLRILLKRKFAGDMNLESIIEQFEELIENDDVGADEDELRDWFDGIWEELYGWADTDHRLWVRTI